MHLRFLRVFVCLFVCLFVRTKKVNLVHLREGTCWIFLHAFVCLNVCLFPYFVRVKKLS